MKFTVLNAAQHYYRRGGDSTYFFELEKLLDKNGHTVIPFATQDEKNVKTSWEKYFPRQNNFQNPNPRDILNFIYSFPAKKAIGKILKKERINIAHLHIYYGQLTTSILPVLNKNNVPIIQTLHDYRLFCPVYSFTSNETICEECTGHRYWKAISNKCNRNSILRSALVAFEMYLETYFIGAIDRIDHFIAPSRFLKDKMIEKGLPKNKITHIYNFIDTKGIEPAYEEGKYFLYYGRLEKIKGILTLVKAIQSIKDASLVIAGSGEFERELKAYLEKNNILNVSYVGHQSGQSLVELIQKSLCVIVPSEWYENNPYTIIEAFSYGKPVIGSQIGGIPELIEHETTGLLFEMGNMEDLREKLSWALSHKKSMRDMGEMARKKSEELFLPENHYQQVMDLYKKVAENYDCTNR